MIISWKNNLENLKNSLNNTSFFFLFPIFKKRNRTKIIFLKNIFYISRYVSILNESSEITKSGYTPNYLLQRKLFRATEIVIMKLGGIKKMWLGVIFNKYLYYFDLGIYYFFKFVSNLIESLDASDVSIFHAIAFLHFNLSHLINYSERVLIYKEDARTNIFVCFFVSRIKTSGHVHWLILYIVKICFLTIGFISGSFHLFKFNSIILHYRIHAARIHHISLKYVLWSGILLY